MLSANLSRRENAKVTCPIAPRFYACKTRDLIYGMAPLFAQDLISNVYACSITINPLFINVITST